MRTLKTLLVGIAAIAGLLAAGPLWAGAPNASLAGPTRGGLNIVLPYYPATPRAAALGTSTVALEGVDSHNPASLGFAQGFDVAYDYGRVSFDHGPDLDIHRGHVVAPVPYVGGFVKLLGMNLSTRKTEFSRMGADVHVWGREFGFHYGRAIPLPDSVPGRLALGIGGFPSDPSELRLEMPDGNRIAKGRGRSQVSSVRAGALYQIDRFSFGGQFTHIKDELKASFKGVPVRFEDNYYVNIWTVGAGFRPDEKTVLLVQHLFGRAQGEGVRKNYDIFSIGAEREVLNRFALRAGMLDGNLTLGVGIKLPYDFRLDYSFMAQYGEELRKAFGQGDLHIVGVGKSF